MMCNLVPVYALIDDFLRLLISLSLFICCLILSYIFSKKKYWDIAFWISFAVFLASMGLYGYVVHQIYSENTFSYDGFIAGASFITVCGLLFSRTRYTEFEDKILSERAPILFVTFLVFSAIYVSTLNYSFACAPDIHQLLIDALQIIIYPLLLLFAISAFFYRFSICISIFAIGMALFIVENFIFIMYSLTLRNDQQAMFIEISCAIVSIVLSLVSIYILTKAKRMYKERLNDRASS